MFQHVWIGKLRNSWSKCKEVMEKIKQFIKFGIVGISNTLISYVVYVVLVGLQINYLLASIAGFIVSVLNSYYWNNKYVFKKQEDEQRTWWKTLIKTFVSYAGTGLILSNILLVIWVEWIKITEIVAPLINLLMTVPLNFIINKFWAFRTSVKDN